jgi:hypothetical protein
MKALAAKEGNMPEGDVPQNMQLTSVITTVRNGQAVYASQRIPGPSSI